MSVLRESRAVRFDSSVISKSTLLAVLATGLIALGLVSFAAGQLLVAGVCFLAFALTIYVREKNE